MTGLRHKQSLQKTSHYAASSKRYRIKIISVLFTAVAVAIFVMVIAPIINVKKYIQNNTMVKKGLSSNENVFTNISFKAQDANGREIKLKSDKIFEEKKNNFVVDNLAIDFMLSNGENGKVSADKIKAIINNHAESELIGNVQVSLESGLQLKTEHAFINFSKKICYGDANISITNKDIIINAKKYRLDMEKGLLILENKVKGEIKSNKMSSDMMTIQLEKKAATSFETKKPKEASEFVKFVELCGNSSFISSKYSINAKKITYFPDKINANDGVFLIYKKDGKKYDIKTDNLQAMLNKSGNIERIYANNYLTIKEKNVKLSASKGVFIGNKIELLGNVLISSSHGDLFGEIAEMDLKSGEISIKKSSGIIEKK